MKPASLETMKNPKDVGGSSLARSVTSFWATDALPKARISPATPVEFGTAGMHSASPISTSGLGIDIPWENEAALSQHEIIHVQVRLPNDDLRIEFDTRVRNRSLGQGAIVYGFEFDLTGVGVDAPRQVAIRSYVSLRTAELARAQERGRRSA